MNADKETLSLSGKMHLCQINIAHCAYPLDHPEMKEFVDALDYVNSIADQHPGFIWRYKSAESSEVSPWPVEILPNMSIWESPHALKDYIYKTDHLKYLVRKAKWFKKMATPHLVLFWTPADTIPTLAEAYQKLKFLEVHGPSEEAFTLARLFEPACR